MKEALYIDGQLVDIPTKGLGITLNFASNILDGIARHVKNYTNTINIPRTERNAKVLECSGQVSVVSGVPYTAHTADYILDGVKVISGGTCYLLKVAKDYQLTIIWGDDPISHIISSDAMLCDLTGTEVFNVEEHPLIYTDRYKVLPDFGVAWHDSVRGSIDVIMPRSSTSITPLQPAVKLSKILERIGEDYGITFDTTNLGSIFNESYLLVTGRRGTATTFAGESLTATFSRTGEGGAIIPLTSSAAWEGVLTPDGVGLRTLGRYRLHLEGYMDVALSQASTANDITFWVADAEGNLIQKIGAGAERQGVGEYYRCNILADVELEADKQLCIAVAHPSVTRWGDANAALTITSPYAPEVVPFTSTPHVAPYFANLPAVKIIDFLATINAMCNTYLYIEGERAIFTRLTDNVADWSSLLRQQTGAPLISEITFAPKSWAQHNYLTWKNSVVKGDIPIDNAQLGAERTWYDSPFYIPSSRYGIPYYDNKDGAWEFSEPSPHIFRGEYIDIGKSGLSVWALAVGGSGIDFGYIVNNTYASMKAWMQRPKVVVVYMAIEAADLATLQSNGRIYLGQFGAYFALLTIQYKAGTLAKCELLKIS